MKTYKWLRRLMKASALTTVMFIMQACYGSPNIPPEMPDDRELTETDTIVSVNSQLLKICHLPKLGIRMCNLNDTPSLP